MRTKLACAAIAALMLLGIFWFIGNVVRPQCEGLASNVYQYCGKE